MTDVYHYIGHGFYLISDWDGFDCVTISGVTINSSG